MQHVFYSNRLNSHSLAADGTLSFEELDPANFRFIVSTDEPDVFRAMNVVTGDPEIELPIRLGTRSMCVGDLYIAGNIAYICAPTGWYANANPDFIKGLKAQLPV